MGFQSLARHPAETGSTTSGPLGARLRRLLAIMALISAPFMPAIGHAEDQPAVIRFGIPASVNAHGGTQKGSAATIGPVVIAALEKAFAGTGTKLEYKYFVNAGPGINEAFASGQIDFAFYGDFPAIIAKAGGIDIKLVAPESRGSSDSDLVVPIDSTAKSIQDLKGKRVSLNMGRPWMLAFERLLGANGLTMADFQIYNLVMPDGDAAVAAHNVDGQVTLDLDALKLESRGLAKIIWSTRTAPLDWKFSADLFARTAFINQYPDATQRIVDADLIAARYNSDPANRQTYIGYIADIAAVPDALEQKAWEAKDTRVVLSPLFDPFVAAHYAQTIDFAIQNHLIRHKIDVADLLDPQFDQEGLKTLKLENYWTPLDPHGVPLKGVAQN